MKDSRGVVLVVLIVVAIFAGAYWIGAPTGAGGPLDPRSHEPNGTSALVALLEELGAEVDLAGGQPDADADVALMLRDRLDDGGRDRLERWVRDGHTLVVTDPGSPLTPSYFDGELAEGAFEPDSDEGLEIDQGECDVSALDDVETIEVFAGAVRYDVGRGDQSCFGSGARAYVVVSEEGDGTVVSLGGAGILQNRSLGDVDNAPLVAALVAPLEGYRVSVLDPLIPSIDDENSRGRWDVIPTGTKRFLVQLGIALAIYVLWRSRRLGRPVEEPQPVKVASAELVSAVGGLLERSKSPQHAADLLRAELRRELSVRLGLAGNIDPGRLAPIVADRTTLDPARLQAALGPGPVTTDADLLAVAQLVDIVRKEVLDHVGT